MLKDLILKEFNKSLMNEKRKDKLNMILKDEIIVIKETGDKNENKHKR